MCNLACFLDFVWRSAICHSWPLAFFGSLWLAPIVLAQGAPAVGVQDRAMLDASFLNSIGQSMVRIEPGTYIRGSREGDRDEEPLHRVKISEAFHLSATEVTNAQFEQFSPSH